MVNWIAFGICLLDAAIETGISAGWLDPPGVPHWYVAFAMLFWGAPYFLRYARRPPSILAGE